MMKNRSISEVTMAMMPETQNKLSYSGFFTLSDNLDSEYEQPYLYSGEPCKLCFATVIICVNGRMDIRVNLQDMSVADNTVLVLPPGCIVDRVCREKGARQIGFFISDYERDYIPVGRVTLQLRRLFGPEPTAIRLEQEAIARTISIYRLLREAVTDSLLTHRDYAINGYLQAISAYWLSAAEKRKEVMTGRQRRSDMLFEQFIELVKANYTVYREVAFYASQLCVTPKYLGVVVRNASGRRPLDWITAYTILDAKAMIVSGKYSIQQIADALNFANASFFIKYFKKHVGVTPGKYM